MSNLVTLRPGARGTIQLVCQYGEALLFVRYRYLTSIRRRYKTVELIIDDRPWIPRNAPLEWLSLYIGDDDIETMHCIETHGGKWDEIRGVWLLPGYKVHQLGLEECVIPDAPFPDDVSDDDLDEPVMWVTPQDNA